MEFKMQRNKLRLKHYKKFDWKRHFVMTFGFLLIIDLIMFVLIPPNISKTSLITYVAISLYAILLVCAIITPIIIYWYKFRIKTISTELRQLNSQISTDSK